MILGTAGHIDHGKTQLVRALTGVDTDRLPEEKKRGITIDLGFAPLEIDGAGTIGVVDVPGHEAFVRTMLAGASGIDIALLVVAADEGVMPQTREHLEILSLLGIPQGMVAVTKRDLVDDEWLALVVDDIRKHTRETFLRDCQIVAVSAFTGEGIPELKGAIAGVAAKTIQRSADDVFRMPVDRAFSVKGTGTVVTGTVWSGAATDDETLIIQPGGKRARVRAIQNHGATVASAQPGARTAIALAGCDVEDVGRGIALVADKLWIPTAEIEVTLSMPPDFSPRRKFRFHLGTGETNVRFAHRFRRDDVVVARAILDDPIIARAGDRFVVRGLSPVETVGGGVVIDPYPPRWRRAIAELPAPASDVERLARILALEGDAGIELGLVPIRTGLAPRDAIRVIKSLGAVAIKDTVISAESLDRLCESLVESVSLEMANHPLQHGVSLEKLRRTTRTSASVMEYVVARLTNEGRIEVEGSVVRPRGWNFKLDKKEEALRNAILHDICVSAIEPPSVAELSGRFGSNTVAMLRRMEREGVLERVAEDRYYARDAVDGMVGTLKTSMERGRQYTPSELREVLGVSRKYLIPFLEFCDRKGVTIRADQGRTLSQEAGD